MRIVKRLFWFLFVLQSSDQTEKKQCMALALWFMVRPYGMSFSHKTHNRTHDHTL